MTSPEATFCPSLTLDRKSTRLNSSHEWMSYAVFCLKKISLQPAISPDQINGATPSLSGYQASLRVASSRPRSWGDGCTNRVHHEESESRQWVKRGGS